MKMRWIGLVLISMFLAEATSFASPERTLSIKDSKGREFLSNEDVKCGALIQFGSKALVNVRFSDAAQKRVKSAVKKNLNKNVTVFLCGKKVKEQKVTRDFGDEIPPILPVPEAHKECIGKILEKKPKC